MTTTTVMPLLEAVRDALAAVPGVKTCKIGLEANMTPADYPIVRVVPGVIKPAGVITRRRAEILVYFGQPLHEFSDGLETLYADLLDMELAIVNAIEDSATFVGFYRETVTDEDRLDAYKLMAVRCEVEG